ncbi:MAG: sulfite exporter TauE/SafE family protein [Bacteroidota bacterium]
MEPIEIAISVGGGFLAGVINTLAGSGSVITLAILTELLGLPGAIANGTNRIGIALQTASSSLEFQKAKILSFSDQKKPLFLMLAGAMGGIILAMNISNEQFMDVFKYMVVALFFVILIKPKRWIHPDETKPTWPKPILNLAFFGLGVYGGFIQMGMGVFFLAIAVLGARLPLIKANVIKVLAIGLYTVPAIILFAIDGKIHWMYGLTIGVGQMTGGWITAKYAVKFPKINTYAYFALLVAVLLSLSSLFDIL